MAGASLYGWHPMVPMIDHLDGACLSQCKSLIATRTLSACKLKACTVCHNVEISRTLDISDRDISLIMNLAYDGGRIYISLGAMSSTMKTH